MRTLSSLISLLLVVGLMVWLVVAWNTQALAPSTPENPEADGYTQGTGIDAIDAAKEAKRLIESGSALQTE